MNKEYGIPARLSSVDLDDSDCVMVDDGEKSVAYFCLRTPVRVGRNLLDELRTRFDRIAPRNLRLCLHDSPQASFHHMIVFERSGKYYRPHKHANKNETFQIIEGRMGVFSFDDEGNIIDRSLLSQDGDLIYKVSPDMYHAVMPISDIVVYHESKPGPFTGAGDSIYPKWAPDEQATNDVNDYRSRLEASLNTQ